MIKIVSLYLLLIIGSGRITIWFCEIEKANSPAWFSFSSKSKQDEMNEFIRNAILDGIMMEQLGQIARQKAVSLRVRNFGQLIENDHMELNDELRKVAKVLNVIISENIDKKRQKEINKLNKKNGVDFDKAFMNKMTEYFDKNILYYETSGPEIIHPDLKKWIENTVLLYRERNLKADETLLQINQHE